MSTKMKFKCTSCQHIFEHDAYPLAELAFVLSNGSNLVLFKNAVMIGK